MSALLVGCAGGGEESAPEPDAPTDVADAATGTEPPERPAHDVSIDPSARLGPETRPDRDEEPEKFLYWRIDRMFERSDADGNGLLTRAEFVGETVNFERMDADGDGNLTRTEVADDMFARLQETGHIQ
jgi:hypothetical protein